MNSDFIVKEIEHKGRGIIALREFKYGDIIFTEEPFVACQFSWNLAYGYSACDYCLKPLENAEENARRLTANKKLELPFADKCETNKSQQVECEMCITKYCSIVCLNKAFNNFHKTLCIQTKEKDSAGSHPFEILNNAWKNIHYPPEECSIMLLARIIAMIQQSDNKEKMIERLLIFYHDASNDKFVHKLFGEKYKNDVELLRELFINALPSDGIEQFFTPEGFLTLFALVGMNGQGIGTTPIIKWYENVKNSLMDETELNNFELFVDQLYKDIDNFSGEFINSDGSGLYELQSKINHSCNPNAEAVFLTNDFVLHLRALKDILPGEEICISYLDECQLNSSRHSRQKYIVEYYTFICKCDKCEEQAGDPDVTSSDESENEDESMDED